MKSDDTTGVSGAPSSAETPSRPPTVVGIGASAGGLEPLEHLVARLAPGNLAFVVLQHLAPTSENVLTEILQRKTALKVVTAADRIEVEPGVIYIAPPGQEVTLLDDRLRLSPVPERSPRHPIDTLFFSLASQQGPASMGVVLSGAGDDGTLGVRAIKDEGGLVFAQTPASASQPSMPRSVVDAGLADFCATPSEIGDELVRVGRLPYVSRKRPPKLFDEKIVAAVFEQLRRAFRVDFSTYKLSTIERRIERRMAVQKIERIEDYLTFLERSPAEVEVLYGDLLIGVTAFFRDREPWEALKTVVFPRLLDKRAIDVPVRIWVAGCASGEEAYSAAICLLEYLGSRAVAQKIQIFATDIDEVALTKARQGIYPQHIALDISAERIQRFFARHEKGYQISRQIRDMVVFARHNLGKDPPFLRLDLVTCRNVLIYMQAPLQKKVLRVFHYALAPEGALLLGTSESVGEGSDLFSLSDRKLKIYFKKNIPSAAVFDFAPPVTTRPGVHGAPGAVAQLENRPSVNVQQLADRKVIEKYGPPGVLVNERLEVVQFRGQTGPFLSPTPGVATLNLLKLIAPELVVTLRAQLQKVLSENLPVSSEPVALSGNRAVILDVMPIHEPNRAQRSLLVVFREVPPADGVLRPPVKNELEVDPRLQELERELATTKEYLQSTVTDLEATNEELQSSNEELQSSNEELQSTNEELETSKEELQSTNEELSTVNEELSNRMGQLSVSNDDLQNVMAIVTAPVVIVGPDLRIRRYSTAAERLLNLIATDLGRPVGHLSTAVNAPIDRMLAEVIHDIRPRELRVRCPDGNWYTMSVLPYRTADNAIRGALIEFTRVPPGRPASEPAEINELVGKVLSTLPHQLLLLDDQLRVVWTNRAFFVAIGVGAEIIGRPLDEVWNGRATHQELWTRLEEAASEGKAFEGVVVENPFGREGKMAFSGKRIAPEGERPTLVLVVIEEVGQR